MLPAKLLTSLNSSSIPSRVFCYGLVEVDLRAAGPDTLPRPSPKEDLVGRASQRVAVLAVADRVRRLVVDADLALAGLLVDVPTAEAMLRLQSFCRPARRPYRPARPVAEMRPSEATFFSRRPAAPAAARRRDA